MKRKTNSKKFIEDLIQETSSQFLYFVQFHTGCPLFIIGSNLKQALEDLNLRLSLDIKMTFKVEDFSCLLRLEKEHTINIINKRKVCKTKNFTCLFDDYEKKSYWLCFNHQTGQSIKLY